MNRTSPTGVADNVAKPEAPSYRVWGMEMLFFEINTKGLAFGIANCWWAQSVRLFWTTFSR